MVSRKTEPVLRRIEGLIRAAEAPWCAYCKARMYRHNRKNLSSATWDCPVCGKCCRVRLHRRSHWINKNLRALRYPDAPCCMFCKEGMQPSSYLRAGRPQLTWRCLPCNAYASAHRLMSPAERFEKALKPPSPCCLRCRTPMYRDGSHGKKRWYCQSCGKSCYREYGGGAVISKGQSVVSRDLDSYPYCSTCKERMSNSLNRWRCGRCGVTCYKSYSGFRYSERRSRLIDPSAKYKVAASMFQNGVTLRQAVRNLDIGYDTASKFRRRAISDLDTYQTRDGKVLLQPKYLRLQDYQFDDNRPQFVKVDSQILEAWAVTPASQLDEMIEAEAIAATIDRLVSERGLSRDDAERMVRDLI